MQTSGHVYLFLIGATTISIRASERDFVAGNAQILPAGIQLLANLIIPITTGIEGRET